MSPHDPDYRYAVSGELRRAGDPEGELHTDFYPTILVRAEGEGDTVFIHDDGTKLHMPFEPWTVLLLDGVRKVHHSDAIPEDAPDRETLQLTYYAKPEADDPLHPRDVSRRSAYHDWEFWGS